METNKELWKHKNIHACTHVCVHIHTHRARHTLPYGITGPYLADGLSTNKRGKKKKKKKAAYYFSNKNKSRI